MKQLTTIIITFVITFGTSALLDWPYIYLNPIRYAIVTFFILTEFWIGFQILKAISKN